MTSYIFATILLLIGFIFPIWLMSSTKYMVDNTALKLKCGPFKWSIELIEIKNVMESNDIISSPALSVDRLAISYGKSKVILVSPKVKQGFIKALKLKKIYKAFKRGLS